MGKRGPLPQSADAKAALGTLRPDRVPSVLPAEGAPSMPAWIDAEAIPYWDELVAMLQDSGVLSRQDAVALAFLAEAVEEYVDLRKEVKARGYVSVSEKGGAYQNPVVGTKNKAREFASKLMDKFGMTTTARVGLVVSGKKQSDPMADLLERIANQRSKN